MASTETGSLSSSGGREGAVSETILVEDIFNADKGHARGPVRALMAALLFDGVQAYIGYVTQSSCRNVARHKEAFHWVNRKGSEYIFSFDSVCEGLGIDPEYLRYGLLNTCSAKNPRKQSRRTF